MSGTLRGADALVRSLANAGVRNVFSLSGNHVMPVYDAMLDAGLRIVHVRHEAAAVHMADAWGRLTGEPGIALVTGGPGHANAVSALYTALASESPVVLISGHASLGELHKGAFQEMRQAELAAPVVKASFTSQRADQLGVDLARALRHAKFGRPGPVHLSVPFDLLEARVEADAVAGGAAFETAPIPFHDAAADAVLTLLAAARRPIIITGPAGANEPGRAAVHALAERGNWPVLCMESPRGVNDPSLGAFAGVLARADLIVLAGKQIDFTLRFGQPPAIDGAARWVLVDADPEALRRSGYALGDASRIAMAVLGDPFDALRAFARDTRTADRAWYDEVSAAVARRPEAWRTLPASKPAAVHPVEVGRAVQGLIDGAADAVFVSDGGEFGQWSQALVSAPARVINGPAGAIGSALPFAIAAKLARPEACVVAMLGDGTFGFHMAEFDTAVRESLPFVAVVGNDRCWNAEHQIQLRAYGAARAHACELLATRYDQVAVALGGHGELVEEAAALPAALERAMRSGLPACVNVMIDRLPAPALHA